MKLIIVIIFILIFAGCISAGDLKKHAKFNYSGEVKGKHSVLAACVIDSMESDERWQISSLHYDLRSYPDLNRSEVLARGEHTVGSIYGLRLRIDESEPGISTYTIKSLFEFEGVESQKILKSCADV